jgi:DNA-binding transcriptional regulator YiaG
MYHYVECGLDNVQLRNGFVVKQTPYGEAVAIQDVEGLHLAIGIMLAEKPGKLSGQEFRFLRKELGLSQENLGAILGNTDQAIAKWEKTNKIPLAPERLLRGIYLEAKTGEAGLMQGIKRINELDHELYTLSLRDEGKWEEDELVAA